MAVVIAAIERQIADHPEQWLSALAQVWDDDRPDATDATDDDSNDERRALTTSSKQSDERL